jgi:hypothetical protein
MRPGWGTGGPTNAPYEGAFASAVLGQNLETLAPFASALGGTGAWRAAPGGLLQGRFGWGDPATGLVSNAQQTAQDALGVVIPLESINYANGGVVGGPARLGGPQARWTWMTWDRGNMAWRLRAGLVVTLMPTGAFYLRFAGGANYGDTVYASQADGSAVSGAASGTVATRFKVCQNAGRGLAIVSSNARFT